MLYFFLNRRKDNNY